MKKALILLLLTTYSHAHAQMVNPDSIYGTWICREAAMVDAEKMDAQTKSMMETMRKGFTGAKFIFKAGGNFNFQLPKDPPQIMRELAFIDNKKWRYSPDKKMISIGTAQDNFNHLRLIVNEKDGVITFLMTDTPLVLRMEKL